MSLWWLQPGWMAAHCSSCGTNIWNSGGDPDWGECLECFGDSHSQGPEPSSPRCDICKTGESVTGVNGFGVCSQECADRAAEKKGETG